MPQSIANLVGLGASSVSQTGAQQYALSMPAESIKSVFTTGYISTSKAGYFTVGNTGYFALTEIADTTIPSASQYEESTTSYWQMIVMSISEGHSEKYSLHNTLSDSIGVFAGGAKPVELTITGKVLLSETDDHYYEFLKKYIEGFRTRIAYQNDTLLHFISKDTAFKLIIRSISIGHKVEGETYVDIAVSGVAYGYKMLGSSDPLSFGYYGSAESLNPMAKKTDSLQNKKEINPQDKNKKPDSLQQQQQQRKGP